MSRYARDGVIASLVAALFTLALALAVGACTGANQTETDTLYAHKRACDSRSFTIAISYQCEQALPRLQALAKTDPDCLAYSHGAPLLVSCEHERDAGPDAVALPFLRSDASADGGGE